MREIKFRAWDKKHKRYNKGGFWVGGMRGLIALVDQNDECGFHAFITDDYILEQFTSLKDKNGKEIYEGDIVRHIGNADSDPKNTFGEIHHVYGCEAQHMKREIFYVLSLPCGFVLRHSSAWGKGVDDTPNQIINNYAIVTNYDFWNLQAWYEVIGNMHQNPELMKDE
jgi:uncharacterized phage protein (TIGR01671 family)